MQDNNFESANSITLQFADSVIPEFKEDVNGGFVKFGKDNKYPDYLIHLLNKSAKHNAIVNSKATY